MDPIVLFLWLFFGGIVLAGLVLVVGGVTLSSYDQGRYLDDPDASYFEDPDDTD